MSDNNKIRTYEMLFIGTCYPGKTSIIKRINNNSFQNYSLSTIGIDKSTKMININNKKINVILWDTSCYLYQSIQQIQMRKKIDILIFVYDITKINSFETIKNLLNNERQNINCKRKFNFK